MTDVTEADGRVAKLLKEIQELPLELVEGQTLKGADVHLDGREFRKCVFDDCRVSTSLGRFRAISCDFSGSRLDFGRPARAVFELVMMVLSQNPEARQKQFGAPTFEERAGDTLRNTLDNHSNDLGLQLLGSCFAQAVYGLNSLHGSQLEDEHWVVAAQITLATNSMKCAYDLLLTGYYAQAMVLERQAHEAWLSAVYVHRHPEMAKRWMGGGERRFPSVAKMEAECIKEWSALEETWPGLRERLRKHYDVQSRFAHARTLALAATVRTLTEREASQDFEADKTMAFNLGGIYDGVQFHFALAGLVPTMAYIMAVLELFVRNEEWLDRTYSLKHMWTQWTHETPGTER
jgi:hypothetical protein